MQFQQLLNETGSHYVKRGFDVDKFMDPAQPDQTDAIFVKGPNLLIHPSVTSCCA